MCDDIHMVLCSELQSVPMFIFANQAGLDMLETTLVALQDITLDKIFDESGRKALFADFAKLMQQVISSCEHVHIKRPKRQINMTRMSSSSKTKLPICPPTRNEI